MEQNDNTSPLSLPPLLPAPDECDSPSVGGRNPLAPTVRVRHDGWTHARTKTFLATLRLTGCVADAARVIGMSTTSAYRLHTKDAKFRALWAEAVADSRRGLIAVAHERAVVGKETLIYRGGEEVERRVSPDSSILALLIKRGDNGAARGPDGRFTGGASVDGGALTGQTADGDADRPPGPVADTLEEKLQLINNRLKNYQRDRRERGLREINIKTGEGFTPEVLDAAKRFAENPETIPDPVEHDPEDSGLSGLNLRGAPPPDPI